MRKIESVIFSIVFMFLMIFSFLLPITKVFAYGSGEDYLNVEIGNQLGFTLGEVTVNSYQWSSADDEFHSDNSQYHIIINVSKNQSTGDKIPSIQYGGNWNNSITLNTQQNNDNYTFTLDVNNSGHQTFLGLSIVEGNGNNTTAGSNFDGKAYLIWSCESGGVCYHHFTDIPGFDDGNSTFYRASEVHDSRTGEEFNVDAEYKGWATDQKFDYWVTSYKAFKNINGDINWATVDPKDIVGDPLDMREYEQQAIEAAACTKENTEREVFEQCVDQYVASIGVWNVRAKLQPLPDEPVDNNAYVSYGDRNFKVVIYNDNYKGIRIGDLSELSYYPAYYTNPFVRQDQFDISGTSKNNPTVIDSILLENTIRIKRINCNSFDISNIEALDVSDHAVHISKDGNEWRLVFLSNFYDNVVFKVTDSNGGVEYFKVHRYTIDGNLRMRDHMPVIVSNFYFDRTKSYTDFDVNLKIVYKDGKYKNVRMSAVLGVDDGLGNITPEYEVDEQEMQEFGNHGKGLKKSTFEYPLNEGEEETISKVYINVEYKGSTNDNYAGAFTGSGKGVEIKFAEDE